MPSESLLPPPTNTLSEKPQNSSPLISRQEIGYGEQLSTFTELKQGKRSGNLFSNGDEPAQAPAKPPIA